jgi:tetratricopeptide (TPR) repeat protein
MKILSSIILLIGILFLFSCSSVPSPKTIIPSKKSISSVEDDSLILKGNELRKKHQYDSALACYSKVIAANPVNANAIFEKAKTYKRKKNIDSTFKYLFLAQEYDTERIPEVYAFLASCYLELEEYNYAKLVYENALENTESLELWYDYAIFQMRIKDYDGAESCLKNCVRINPNDPNTHFQFSRLYDFQARLYNSLLASLKYLAIDPQGKYSLQAYDNFKILMTERLVRRSDEKFVVTYKKDILEYLRKENIKHIYIDSREDTESSASIIRIMLDVTKGKYDDLLYSKDEVIFTQSMLYLIFPTLISFNENFVNQNYLEFFINLGIAGHTYTFAYYILQSKELPDVEKWLAENQSCVYEMQEWIENYKYKK